ncbi:MAG: polysaccharide deacetylase family protein [Isosphaeraceae bacterium]|nr:polysaccharide deacetylase family protein [Isosphaeraceae bacterium]
MLIRNKREFLANRLRDAGVLRLLERAARRPVLLVLTYHRIGEPATSPYYEPVYSATPEVLRAQLRHLRDRFHTPALEAIDPEGNLREPTALVTFDDGYRDNVDAALPVLADVGVPATFFLPAALIDRPRLPWWDHASYVIKRTSQDRLVLDQPGPLTLDLARDGRAAALQQVIRLYLDGLVADEDAFRAHLQERADVSVDEQALGRALFLDWDDARRLVSSGMSVGSHGHSHRRLSSLSEDEQGAELVESKRVLQEQTGRDVRALAYPFGWPGTFNDATERLAREARYRLAFSAIEGVNAPQTWHPFALRRLNIGASDSPTLVRARAALHVTFGGSCL